MQLLDERFFAVQMEHEVEPYLARFCRSGRISPELDIYYELYPRTPNNGTVVICHGFTENTRKYHEFIYYLHREGYQVAIYDQRGHGRSFRETKNRNVVHVKHFNDYVTDLHVFVHKVAARRMTIDRERLYLFGHSMGGCVAARYIERYPGDFAKAVLNAPMLGIQFGWLPTWCAQALCMVEIAMGHGKKRIFNQTDFDPLETYENSSTNSRVRFDYYRAIRQKHPEYQTSAASYLWGREAIRAGRKAVSENEVKRIRAEVLMFIAGQDRLVERGPQDAFMEHLGGGRAILLPECRHEIFRSDNRILKKYFAELLGFLAE